MLLGTMLGDGSMSTKNQYPRYRSRHGWKQHEYNLKKYTLLSAFVRTPPKKQKNGGFGEWSNVWATLTSPEFSPIASLCLRGGRKFVTTDWLNHLTWEGVAWWFMDDGSRCGRNLMLCTHGFSEPEVRTIRDWFVARNLDARIGMVRSRRNPEKTWPVLRFNIESSHRFADLVRPHVLSEMSYKLALPPRLTSITCAWCGQTFEPARGWSPASAMNTDRPCCASPACRKSRRKAHTDRYVNKPGNREQINQKQQDRYYADHEKSKESARKRTARWLAKKSPEELKAIYEKQVAKKQAARAKKIWTCRRCQLSRPQGKTDTRTKYCEACRPVVTSEIKKRNELKKRKSSG